MAAISGLADAGRNYKSFMEAMRDPAMPTLSPQRYTEWLQIDMQLLAEQARVHRNTITRAPASRGVQDFLREAMRVIKAASDLTGDLDRALFWYRNEPLAPFSYQTAERLVAAQRADDVVAYIESLQAGAAG